MLSSITRTVELVVEAITHLKTFDELNKVKEVVMMQFHDGYLKYQVQTKVVFKTVKKNI